MIIQVCKVKIVEPKVVSKTMPKDAADRFTEQFGMDDEAIEKIMKRLEKGGLREFMGEGRPFDDFGHLRYDTYWGTLTIVREKLTKSERHHSFRHRYSYVGPFRYPHRALLPISDGRAWHHRASGKGGTVLIDCSGSMSLKNSDILEVLKSNPLATVAIYHGLSKTGTLNIVASSNRYCADLPHRGGGNIVDAPALKWLARQERPRWWVCDGGVTGVGDISASPTMLVEVAMILKKADIKWARSLSELPKGHL